MILVTGPDSMIGRAIINELRWCVIPYLSVSHKECDLENYNECYSFFESSNCDTLIHLAGYNGNIQFNINHPTDIFFKTSQMALNTLRCAEKLGFKRVIAAISSCAYPDLSGAMHEDQFWQGECNYTVSCHGYAKRILDAYGEQLIKKGISYTSCIIQNSFGPFDSLDLNKTKVVTALIKKFILAKKANKDVTLWGTGAPKRDFIYCKDVAKIIVYILSHFDGNRINIGSGSEISIKELANIISNLVGFEGNIIWDTSQPDGQKQKKLDVSVVEKFGIKITPIEQALKETISWVESQL